ncbi:MAG: BamA/TamA family outer membrane protein [Muribaculaceae bacterium]
MTRYIKHILILFTVMIIAAGCSTTKRLAEDEVLYTGVKHLRINAPDSAKIPSGVKSQISSIINVKPNNPLFSPYVRSPLPIGLWVYNNLEVTSKKGFKHWIYSKLAKDPVLISDVRPELRVEMIKDVLKNNGYFESSESYELLIDKKNKKKARINYNVNPGVPYTISEIQHLQPTSDLAIIIDSLARKESYLKIGNQYCVDSLNAVRTNITNIIRNRGYFYFRPEYIEYLADSTITNQQIAMRMILATNIPNVATVKYRTGKITTYVNRNKGGGYPDTIVTKRGTVVQMKPSHLRPSLIPSCITFKEGKTFSVRDMNRTQSYLSRLGIFNAINIEVNPADSIIGNEILDVNINCTFDSPLEATFELNGTSKSNSYIGPGAIFGLIHRNIFGGGEQLSTNLTASYQWQTGKSSGNNSDYNSYKLGITTSLAFPRLLAPKFIDRSKRNLNWTRITLNAELLNHPNYIKVAQFNASFAYEWHTNRKSLHELTLLKLTYSKTLKRTEQLDSLAFESPAIEMIWGDKFIPQLSYTYTFDHAFGYKKRNHIVWKSTVSEGGNVMSGIWALAGAKGGVENKKLFGIPFSQFIKAQSQLVYSRSIFGNHSIVSRAFVGVAHAYGNSEWLPYTEEFYIGGANSIRAFASRSIGPGSYHEDAKYDAMYFHGGTFKLELNVEYRFPIFGPFHGALFLDTGNVWLLKDDDDFREGAKLTGKTFLKELALGTGVGLRFDIGMLVLRADLGIGIHAPYNTGRSGYYNMTSFKNSLAFHLAIGYPF